MNPGAARVAVALVAVTFSAAALSAQVLVGNGFFIEVGEGWALTAYAEFQAATETPSAAPAVFGWPGSCPTGCCGYGTTWRATQAAPAFADPPVPGAPPSTAPPAFTIPAGAAVRAVTGTLYTLETGAARVDEDFSTDATYTDFSTRHKRPVTFLAGHTIELLAPRGDGVYRIVHDGSVIDANLYRFGTPESCKDAIPRCAGVITKPPATEWWVMVLTEGKQSGWINEPVRFTRGSCK